MAKFEVLEKSFINDAIHEPGHIVEMPDDFTYDKARDVNLRPIAGTKRAKEDPTPPVDMQNEAAKRGPSTAEVERVREDSPGAMKDLA